MTTLQERFDDATNGGHLYALHPDDLRIVGKTPMDENDNDGDIEIYCTAETPMHALLIVEALNAQEK